MRGKGAESKERSANPISGSRPFVRKVADRSAIVAQSREDLQSQYRIPSVIAQNSATFTERTATFRLSALGPQLSAA